MLGLIDGPLQRLPFASYRESSPQPILNKLTKRCEKEKKKCTFWICASKKLRPGEARERQAKGGIKGPVVNNSKKVSSWAEADVKREHHRAASASVFASQAQTSARLH